MRIRELSTERLRLREPCESDASSVLSNWASDPKVTKYLTWEPYQSEEQCLDYITRCLKGIEAGRSATWFIELSSSAELIGSVGASIDSCSAEIGYVLGRKYWGHGFMREATRAMVAELRETYKVDRVWGTVDIENAQCIRVLESLGFEKEGCLRKWAIHPAFGDGPRDCFSFASVRPSPAPYVDSLALASWTRSSIFGRGPGERLPPALF